MPIYYTAHFRFLGISYILYVYSLVRKITLGLLSSIAWGTSFALRPLPIRVPRVTSFLYWRVFYQVELCVLKSVRQDRLPDQ